MGSDELEIILKGCQNNRNHYKEALYKSFYGYVKGVVIRYVEDYHYAEELVNDSFIKIFKHIDTFNGLRQAQELATSFKSWIAKIASRTAIDFLRKKRIDFEKEELAEAKAPFYLHSPADVTAAKDIIKLLNLLPQTQKTVFNLYEIEGFSHQEIAGILGISENVSRSYLSRAKGKLKALYTETYKV